MVYKHRNMFRQNKKQETTEIGRARKQRPQYSREASQDLSVFSDIITHKDGKLRMCLPVVSCLLSLFRPLNTIFSDDRLEVNLAFKRQNMFDANNKQGNDGKSVESEFSESRVRIPCHSLVDVQAKVACCDVQLAGGIGILSKLMGDSKLYLQSTTCLEIVTWADGERACASQALDGMR
ncbi:hypothetical protein AAG570_008492 [Ranatra chinensis]|uniref:Uncharacterized protein n=1 Tax=Ranatra chinensis TaxID=642074 RepID=A0ABD0ZC76_9HEMI